MRLEREAHAAMGEYLSRVPWETFATLTFADVKGSESAWKAFHWWRKGAEKKTGETWAWAAGLEQPRGADRPHLHALIAGSSVPSTELYESWLESFGRCKVERVGSNRRVALYTSKYVTKDLRSAGWDFDLSTTIGEWLSDRPVRDVVLFSEPQRAGKTVLNSLAIQPGEVTTRRRSKHLLEAVMRRDDGVPVVVGAIWQHWSGQVFGAYGSGADVKAIGPFGPCRNDCARGCDQHGSRAALSEIRQRVKDLTGGQNSDTISAWLSRRMQRARTRTRQQSRAAIAH